MPAAQPQPSPERDRIGRALVELCFERGYRNTTLAMLLERAEVDRRTFERQYADLEDCFCQTLQPLAEDYLLRLGDAFATQRGWRNQLRVTAYAALRFLREDLPRARFLFVEVLYAGTRAQLIRDQGIDALTELIDRGRSELDDPDSVSRQTAVAIAGGLHEKARQAIDADDPNLWEALVPQLMYAAVLPYLGPEAALQELQMPAPGKR